MYKTLINRNVKKAFDLLQDLTDSIILTKKDTSFDFGTEIIDQTVTETITTKGLITEFKNAFFNQKIGSKILMLKTQDIGDISIYDSVSLADTNYKIGPVIQSDGYLTIVEIYE